VYDEARNLILERIKKEENKRCPDWVWLDSLMLQEFIGWDFFCKYIHGKCHFSDVRYHYNPNFTWDVVQANPHFPFIWRHVSANATVTMDIIKANKDKPWDYQGVSYNPNLTAEFVIENIHKNWDWNVISSNHFSYHPLFLTNAYRRTMTKRMHDTIYTELISKACTPERLENWNEDFNADYMTEK
jgi:hypothetical protein